MNNHTKNIIAREFLVLLGTGAFIILFLLLCQLISDNDRKIQEPHMKELDSIEEKIKVDGLRYWDFMNLLHLKLIENQLTESSNPNSFIFWKSACKKYHSDKVGYQKRLREALNDLPNVICRVRSMPFSIGNNWETIKKTLENEPYSNEDSTSWLQFVALDKARNARVQNILAQEQSWTRFANDESFIFSVILIIVSIAFPIRYLVYMTIWSIKNLKSS